MSNPWPVMSMLEKKTKALMPRCNDQWPVNATHDLLINFALCLYLQPLICCTSLYKHCNICRHLLTCKLLAFIQGEKKAHREIVHSGMNGICGVSPGLVCIKNNKKIRLPQGQNETNAPSMQAQWETKSNCCDHIEEAAKTHM